MSENRPLQSATATSEDETFLKLKRVPISELDIEFRQRMWAFYAEPKRFREWLDKQGWEENDFFIEGKKFEESLRKRNL